MGIAIDAMPFEIDNGDLQTRYLELGEMAIRHARVPAGADMAPLLAGLPGGRCPSPHWGLVLEGTIRMEHADGSIETAKAGEVYHWPAGHTATTDEAVVFIEVGPVEHMRAFNEHVRGLFAS
jgi:hypothetical protein